MPAALFPSSQSLNFFTFASFKPVLPNYWQSGGPSTHAGESGGAGNWTDIWGLSGQRSAGGLRCVSAHNCCIPACFQLFLVSRFLTGRPTFCFTGSTGTGHGAVTQPEAPAHAVDVCSFATEDGLASPRIRTAVSPFTGHGRS